MTQAAANSRCCLAALLLCCVLQGQKSPPIRTTVPLVIFSASVKDRKGRPIYGLEEKEFEVVDNGEFRKANVDATDVESAPIALVILVQTSDFSAPALARIQKVGAMIPGAVTGANGFAAVVTYDNKLSIQQDFTEDPDKITEAFRRLQNTEESNSRLLDGVELAMQMLSRRAQRERQCILVLGQSRDQGSEAKFSEVLDRIGRTGITLYGMTYSAFLTAFTVKGGDYRPAANGSYVEGIKAAARLGTTNTVTALADATGGEEFTFATKGKLENNLIGLGQVIHSRYLIAFKPGDDPFSRFHRLQVSIKGRSDVLVRSRSGYWSASSKQ